MEELKPCPFCGSRDISIHGLRGYWIACNRCQCDGPTPTSLHPTEEDAIRTWNQRFTSDDTV